MAKFILASSSKSRLELLKKINIIPDEIIPADIDETPLKGESPIDYVKRIAENKCKKVHESNKNNVILSADTILTRNRKIMQKAYTDKDVENYLKFLSGRNFDVVTAICLFREDNSFINKIEITKVKFKNISDDDIKEYVDSKEGLGKAGALCIEGLCEAFTIKIIGSYSNIIGLPLYKVRNMLKSAGILNKNLS